MEKIERNYKDINDEEKLFFFNELTQLNFFQFFFSLILNKYWRKKEEK